MRQPLRMAAAAIAALVPMSSALAVELPIGKGATYCFDAIEIDASGVYGPDDQCFPVSPATEMGTVLLVCENAEIEYGPPWSEVVTIVEDEAAKTLHYINKDGQFDAERCE